MAYKAVKAIALGSAVLSSGIVHFDPKRKGDGGDRYHGGIFTDADAAILERRKLGKIEGDADEHDHLAWQAHLRATGPGVHRAAAERVEAAVDEDEDVGGSGAVSTILTTAHLPGTPARSPAAGLTLDPDAAPGAGAAARTEGPAELNQSIPKLKADLASIDDVDVLTSLRTAEEAGKNRDGALEAIDARIDELGGSAT